MKEDLKIVFMGTPDFAAASLRKLIEEKFNVIACFTNPDKPSGRGMKLKYSEVKEVALENNINVFQPAKLRKNEEVIDTLKELEPDLIVVVAYGKILPKEILEIPKLGCINVHGSLLPEYRGAAPMQWSLINGDKKTGITTMFMDEGMDTGDMLLKEEVEITEEDNFETLHDKMKEVGANLLVKTINSLQMGNLKRIKQPVEGTIAPMISKEMTKIDFNKSSKEIFNMIRGMSPFPGAYMEDVDGKIYKVYKVSYTCDKLLQVENGVVVERTKNSLKIKCKDGSVSILEIKPQNSKKMEVKAFLAGSKIDVGFKFI